MRYQFQYWDNVIRELQAKRAELLAADSPENRGSVDASAIRARVPEINTLIALLRKEWGNG